MLGRWLMYSAFARELKEFDWAGRWHAASRSHLEGFAPRKLARRNIVWRIRQRGRIDYLPEIIFDVGLDSGPQFTHKSYVCKGTRTSQPGRHLSCNP